jgi:hypothetical protein
LQSPRAGGMLYEGEFDMATEQVKTATNEGAVTASDIVFDCPACGKSLVVDEAAEGMIVDCPQCRTNVIVPPKSAKPATPPPSTKEESKAAEPIKAASSDTLEDSLQKRLSVLAGQLKEIQAQRTEVTGRIASRLNDVNRDLVIIARLETAQQQILTEWNQLVEKISSGRAVVESEEAQPAVIGASVSGRTRVSFRQ